LISQVSGLSPGLYLVATPIGNARDITLRALDVFASANALAAEDTRTLRKLMKIHGVAVGDRALIAYHDHSTASVRDKIVARIADGQAVAYASEAGTPLIADPGFSLARAVTQAGHSVTALPGASAVLAGLSLSGLPSDRFTFAGFAPNAGAARRTFLESLAGANGTLVFYESPRRIGKFLEAAIEIFGADRPAAIARELTKKFEEVRRGTLAELAVGLGTGIMKGEVVVMVGGGSAAATASADDIDTALSEAMERLSVKDAAAMHGESTMVK
jgi:16S rRNA (cytidine1402-2'-O)-methyltransferase